MILVFLIISSILIVTNIILLRVLGLIKNSPSELPPGGHPAEHLDGGGGGEEAGQGSQEWEALQRGDAEDD